MSGRQALTELTELRVSRVDLVDAGDNPSANVTLYKRRPELKKSTPLTCPKCDTRLQTSYGDKGETVAQYCAECGAKITVTASGGDKDTKRKSAKGDAMADLSPETIEKLDPEVQKHIEGLTEQLEAATKRATDFETAKKKAEADLKTEKGRADKAASALDEMKKAHPEDTDPLAGVPEDVRKRLEENEEALAKLTERTEIADFEKRATVLDIPGTTPAKIAPIMRRIAKGKSTEADLAEVERLLKGAAALAKKGGLAKDLGADGDPSTAETAYGEATEKAKALQSDGKADTFAKALAMVWKQNPDLYKRHAQERAKR